LKTSVSTYNGIIQKCSLVIKSMLQLNLFYSFGYFYMYSCENTKVCDILIIINDTVESQEFSTCE